MAMAEHPCYPRYISQMYFRFNISDNPLHIYYLCFANANFTFNFTYHWFKYQHNYEVVAEIHIHQSPLTLLDISSVI